MDDPDSVHKGMRLVISGLKQIRDGLVVVLLNGMLYLTLTPWGIYRGVTLVIILLFFLACWFPLSRRFTKIPFKKISIAGVLVCTLLLSSIPFLTANDFYLVTGTPVSISGTKDETIRFGDHDVRIIIVKDPLRKILAEPFCNILGKRYTIIEWDSKKSRFTLPIRGKLEFKEGENNSATEVRTIMVPLVIETAGLDPRGGGSRGLIELTLVSSTLDTNIEMQPWDSIKAGSKDDRSIIYTVGLNHAIESLIRGEFEAGFSALIAITEYCPTALEQARLNTLLAKLSRFRITGEIGRTQAIPFAFRALRKLKALEGSDLREHPLYQWCAKETIRTLSQYEKIYEAEIETLRGVTISDKYLSYGWEKRTLPPRSAQRFVRFQSDNRGGYEMISGATKIARLWNTNTLDEMADRIPELNYAERILSAFHYLDLIFNTSEDDKTQKLRKDAVQFILLATRSTEYESMFKKAIQFADTIHIFVTRSDLEEAKNAAANALPGSRFTTLLQYVDLPPEEILEKPRVRELLTPPSTQWYRADYIDWLSAAGVIAESVHNAAVKGGGIVDGWSRLDPITEREFGGRWKELVYDSDETLVIPAAILFWKGIASVGNLPAASDIEGEVNRVTSFDGLSNDHLWVYARGTSPAEIRKSRVDSRMANPHRIILNGVSDDDQENLRPLVWGHVENSILRIEDYFRGRGYIDVEVTDVENEDGILSIQVKKGEAVMLVEASIVTDTTTDFDFHSEVPIRNGLRAMEGKLYSSDKYVDMIHQINTLLRKRGHSDSSTFPQLRRIEGGIKAEYHVYVGPQYMLGDLIVEGGSVLSNETILAALGLQRGLPIDWEIVHGDRSELEKRHLKVGQSLNESDILTRRTERDNVMDLVLIAPVGIADIFRKRIFRSVSLENIDVGGRVSIEGMSNPSVVVPGLERISSHRLTPATNILKGMELNGIVTDCLGSTVEVALFTEGGESIGSVLERNGVLSLSEKERSDLELWGRAVSTMLQTDFIWRRDGEN